MDDDCTTFVRAKRAISDDLQKSRDKNHVIRNVSNELYKIRERNKGLTVKCVTYFTKCFSYALSQNKENPSGMKRDIQAITPHAFRNHELCDQRWCKYQEDPSKYKPKSLPFGQDLTDASLRTELDTLFEKYITEAMCKRLTDLQCSNANERTYCNFVLRCAYGKSNFQR